MNNGTAQTSLAVTYGSQGLQSLSYKQVLLEDTVAYPADVFHIWHMKSTDLAGNAVTSGQYGWGESNSGSTWDSVDHAWTYQFAWGSIRTRYVQRGDTLDIVVTTSNKVGSGIIFAGASVYPLALHFPQLPAGFTSSTYDWYRDNVSGPSATTADYGSGQVTITSPDASKPLYNGFQHTGAGLGYTALASSTSPDSLAPFMPHYDRKIGPGETDTYTVSLRFADSGTNPSQLLTDTYQSWTAAYPATLHWTDRRAIGTVYLASSPSGDKTQPGGYPNNPRRYFNDGSSNDFDVRTAEGLLLFQQRILRQAQDNVANLKRLNAQGAVTWDIEGEQYPQDTSYVCSPDQLASVAPEMESIVADKTSPYIGLKLVDAYFKTMTDAGMRVGICVRPQQFAINSNGTAQQTTLDSSIVAAQLIRKMRYAHDRWNATLFYLDSTVDALGGTLDASIIQQAAAALPDSLLIPEETTNRHYASSAPFKSFIFHGDLGTDTTVYNYYPAAFSVNLINDADATRLAASQAQLTQSVKMGDILMAHADHWQQNNPTIVAIYQAAGTWVDPTRSTVPVSSSVNLTVSAGSTTFGNTLTLTAALKQVAATGLITFYDGTAAIGSGSISGGMASIALTTLSVGQHGLSAVYDGSASYTASTSGTVNVTVAAIPTALVLTSSQSSASLGTAVGLAASITNGATGAVSFYDGSFLLGTSTLVGGSANLSSAALAVGVHSIRATYTGAAGYADSSSNVLTETITAPVQTTTTLSPSTVSLLTGSSLTLTASVIPPVPSGTVTFYDSDEIIGSATMISGVASLTAKPLSVGAHSFTALFSGTAGYAASTSPNATVSVYAASPTTSNILTNPGFEVQSAGAFIPSWTATGSSPHGVDVNLGYSHSGNNNAYIWDSSSTWNAFSQTVAVQPHTEYVLSGWVRSAMVGRTGYFSIVGGQGIVTETPFGNLPGYTQLVLRFNSGVDATVTVRFGLWGQNTAQWVQIDDVALRPNLIVNPGFELQSTTTLVSPWMSIGTSPNGVDLALGISYSGSNNAYVWGPPAMPCCPPPAWHQLRAVLHSL